jgi:hypothetical protein
VFNSVLGTIITKEFLSSQEKHAFAEHNILYTNKVLHDLNMNIKDFARHVVESLKPKSSFLASKWTWIIIVILIVLMALLFLPSIIEQFGNAAGGGAISQAAGAATHAVEGSVSGAQTVGG